MPRVHEQSNPTVEPGFMVQLVKSGDISTVRRLLETANDESVEKYINESVDGMGVLHWAANGVDNLTMVCLVERINDCEQLSDEFQQSIMRPALRVVGFPVVNLKTPLHIAVHNNSPNIIEPLMDMVHRWDISDDFILKTDKNGYTAIQCAAAKQINTLNSIVNTFQRPRAIGLLNHQGAHGWSSLHVSSIIGNKGMVNCILNYFDDELEKHKFLEERDQEGWSALHWAAARGNTEIAEALINELPTNAKKRLSGATHDEADRSWTVIHACARSHVNTTRTLQMLMDKFDSQSQWQILKCPSINGETALHIAVEENNAHAVLLLLDMAGDNQTELLQQTDDSGKMAVDCATKDRQLEHHLKVSAKVGNLALHQAAMMDDREAINWILRHSPNQKYDLVNKVFDTAGYSALHVAGEFNSSQAIEALLDGMTGKEVYMSITNSSGCGDNAVQIAAKASSLGAMHSLLMSINRDQRRTLLKTENWREGSSILDLAHHSQHMTNLIQGHASFCENDLSEMFIRSEYSFDMTEEQVEQAYSRIEKRVSQAPGFVCHANIDAFVCISKHDYEQAASFIMESLAVDPDNIHAYLNVGRWSMGQTAGSVNFDETELQPVIENAAIKLLELRSNPSAIATAKMEYAYWLAESCRTEGDRNKSCQLMTECLERDIPLITNSEVLKARCRILLMKTTIRWIRCAISDSTNIKSQQWIEEKIKTAMDQLIYLSLNDFITADTSSEIGGKFYQREMLVWLMELQWSNIRRHCGGILQNELQRFENDTGQSSNVKECMKQAIGYLEEYHDDHRFKSRLGRIILEIAYQENDGKERKERFAEALMLSEHGNRDGFETFMSASTCAAAHINIWAIDYYTANKPHIDQLITVMNKLKRPVNLDEGWRFLTTEYYTRNPEKQIDRRTNLEMASEHYETVIARDGYYRYGLKLARVKCLLGDHQSEVLHVFGKYMQSFATGSREHVTGLQHRGRYHKIMGNLDQAQKDLETAFELASSNNLKVSLRLANNDMHHIAKLRQRSGRNNHGSRQPWAAQQRQHGDYRPDYPGADQPHPNNHGSRQPWAAQQRQHGDYRPDYRGADQPHPNSPQPNSYNQHYYRQQNWR